VRYGGFGGQRGEGRGEIAALEQGLLVGVPGLFQVPHELGDARGHGYRPDQVEHDAARHQAWVITDSGTVAGFAIAARKSPAGAEILWIAVDAARRGRGYGTRLLGRVLDYLGADGISVVEAKTLDRSSGYRPYEATRAFWERNGFVHVDTIDPLPGWEPGNPTAIYVAALRPTRRLA
jgi:GNAT superfamily N-acetyltransferase